ncbi:MAG: VWA domain-containing protein [Candidatus Gastranaerophilales bacterium]|nr:VWA domain-containing protein [Candidatus Gastranaerophilales bacterium]
MFAFGNENAIADTETLVIFDASVSMLGNINGQPKYVIAVEAAKKVLGSMDANMPVGLRTIGFSVGESILDVFSNNSDFCQASRLVLPIKKNNIRNINLNLDMIFPLGTTPLTYALQSALDSDFNSNAFKHIILITDGGESCGEDPCAYIKEVTGKRKDVRIDIIAIGVKGGDFNQLKCVAQNTNGEIISAENQHEIEKGFSRAINNPVSAKPSPIAPEQPKKPVYSDDDGVSYKNFLIPSN